MMRRLVLLLSILPFAAILGLAGWMFSLQKETDQLRERVDGQEQAAADRADQERERAEAEQAAAAQAAQAAQIAQNQAVLEAETRRLEGLRAALSEVETASRRQPPTGSVETYIQRTTQRLNETETQLRALSQDAQATDQNAQAYNQQQLAQHGGQQLNLEAQVQALDTQILELQARQRVTQTQPPDGNNANQLREMTSQLAALRTQRDQLNSQIRALGTSAQATSATVAQQTLQEKSQLRVEQQALQQQVADLRADLDYWRSQKSSGARQATQARLSSLQEQIRAQEARVNGLQATAPAGAPENAQDEAMPPANETPQEQPDSVTQ